MSKASIWAMLIVLLIVSNIFTAGKFYQMGHLTQLDTNDMLQLCSTQFFEAVKDIQDQKVSKGKTKK